MSEAAIRERDSRIVWARPGSTHDQTIRLVGLVLPVVIGVLSAILIIAPLIKRAEVSFMLSKDKVAISPERMRVAEALYRGEDDKGHPFSLHAGGAVQKSSKTPVVNLQDLSARIVLDDGPAVLRAAAADYDMDREHIVVPGGLLFESADGYRLTTRSVGIDLKARTLRSTAPVEGKMPLGTFSAGSLSANLNAHSVALEGRAHLHIVQGAIRR